MNAHRTLALLAAALCVLAVRGLAAPPNGPPGPQRPPGEPCKAWAVIHGSQTGVETIHVCVTRTGNAKWSGVVPRHKLLDSYRLCYDTDAPPAPNLSTVLAVDPGPGPGIGFGQPAILQPNGHGSFPLTVVRQTTRPSPHPRFELTQTFDVGSGTSPDLHVDMSLRFLGPDPEVNGVTIVREFDREHPKVNPSPPKPFPGLSFDDGFMSSSRDSALGWNDGENFGLMLTARSKLGINEIGGAPFHQMGVRAPGLMSIGASCTDLGSHVELGPGDLRGRAIFGFQTMTLNPMIIGAGPVKSVEFRYWVF